MTDTTLRATEIHHILSGEDIEDLLNMWEEPEKYHQDFNLFDVSKRMLYSGDRWYKEEVRKNTAAFDKLSKYVSSLFGGPSKEYILQTHYLLEYTPDSFARLHIDGYASSDGDDNARGQTIVTLLEDVNLVGGESIVITKYLKKSRPAIERCNRPPGKGRPYGEDCIPNVIPLNVGQSLIYNYQTQHGVAKVREGSRKVLISWYKEVVRDIG